MKNLKNLGKILNKSQQAEIYGGRPDLGDSECHLIFNDNLDPTICGGMGACYECVPV